MHSQNQQSILVEQSSNVLQEISNSNNVQKPQPKKQVTIKTQDIIYVNKYLIDFGQCLPGTVNQTQLILTLPFPLQPFLLDIKIESENPFLDHLDQYIFGIRKVNSPQYSDECRVKIQQKCPVKIIIGVKTPGSRISQIQGCINIGIVGLKIEPITIRIHQKVRIPNLVCIKQLWEGQNRIIKLLIKKKGKKQCKVPLKNLQNYRYVIESQILTLQNDIHIEAVPKTCVANPKAQFYIHLQVKLNEETKKKIQSIQGIYRLRRVLILKVKQSTLFYHFPIEITFCDQQKNGNTTQ